MGKGGVMSLLQTFEDILPHVRMDERLSLVALILRDSAGDRELRHCLLEHFLSVLTAAERSELLRKICDERKWFDDPVTPHEEAAFRCCVTVATIALVLLRDSTKPLNRYDVLLIRCPDDDLFYPGQLVLPCATCRGNESPEAVFERIQPLTEGVRVTKYTDIHSEFMQTRRGQEMCRFYVAACEGAYAGKGGSWYALKDLPDSLFEGHRALLMTEGERLVWMRKML